MAYSKEELTQGLVDTYFIDTLDAEQAVEVFWKTESNVDETFSFEDTVLHIHETDEYWDDDYGNYN